MQCGSGATRGAPEGFPSEVLDEVYGMKKSVIALILLLACFVGGCGVTASYPTRERRYAQITNLDWREAVDDWDYIWLYDHHVTLTRWHPYVGD